MKLIKVTDRYPTYEKYYKVLCVNGKLYWCKLRAEKSRPNEYSSAYFKHKKRCLRVFAWVEK